jgi:UDPglucose 6-dehydrogenase
MLRQWLTIFTLLITFLEARWIAPEHRAKVAHKVVVVGTGYVGLTVGASLAECGHEVICVDIDVQKIDRLKKGDIPIYEPGLSEMVLDNSREGRLKFTTSLKEAVPKSEIIFLAVPTPTNGNGQADLTILFQAVDEIKPFKDRLICVKSTVPPGTCRKIQDLLKQEQSDKNVAVEVISNPEFFREGCAVKDFFVADRIVIGCTSKRAEQMMKELYAPLHLPMLVTSLESSEMVKYASNAFLAVKIAYANELSQFCEKCGADVLDVTRGMGLDKRIGAEFLKPGPGYGGSCLPKDTVAMLDMARALGGDLKIIAAAIDANEQHKKWIYAKALRATKAESQDKVVAVLGLAFKANTDDVRFSPALGMISSLLAHGVTVRAYDPVASENMKAIFPNITYCESAYEAADGADQIILVTEWEEFLHLDKNRLKESMRTLSIFDARNILDKVAYEENGFCFEGVGRCSLKIK